MPITETLRCVHAAGAILGEGPVWVGREQALYWTDIQGKRIYRFDPASELYASWPTPFRIGSLAPRASGGFVGGSEHGFVFIDEDFGDFQRIGEVDPDRPNNRFNDGKVDPVGRFWAGTMDDAEVERTGGLYRLDGDLRFACQDSGYLVPNGPAFSPDGSLCYHSDSPAQTIFRFALASDGELTGKAVFAKFEPGDGYPDGMATDADGCLWVAFWDGWCLRRLSPDGEIISTVTLPVQRPTSCAFAGTEMEWMFITSASTGLDATQLHSQPFAGGLFRWRPPVRGWEPPCFAG